MTRLLEKAIAKLRELPEAEQDMAAAELICYLEATQDPQLSDAQLAEVRRRRASEQRKFLTLAELDERLRRLGA